MSAFSIIVRLAWDVLQWCGLLLRPRESLTAEILFLRRQLALYRERAVKPTRIDAATRVTLAFLSHWFDWRSALVVVRPETLIRWHRAGFRLWWRWKSRPRRPPIPEELRELIRRMARENPAWGQERIANDRNELFKLANYLKANPTLTATVEGHTGNLQITPELAQQISQHRVQNVMNYLVDNFDIDRSRLNAQGFGQTRRYAYNTSREG